MTNLSYEGNVIDTETTGLSSRDVPSSGLRLGCVELRAGGPTGRVWHSYSIPNGSVPQAAVANSWADRSVFEQGPVVQGTCCGVSRLYRH